MISPDLQDDVAKIETARAFLSRKAHVYWIPSDAWLRKQFLEGAQGKSRNPIQVISAAAKREPELFYLAFELSPLPPPGQSFSQLQVGFTGRLSYFQEQWTCSDMKADRRWDYKPTIEELLQYQCETRGTTLDELRAQVAPAVADHYARLALYIEESAKITQARLAEQAPPHDPNAKISDEEQVFLDDLLKQTAVHTGPNTRLT